MCGNVPDLKYTQTWHFMKETWTVLKSAMNKSTTQNALPDHFIIDYNNVQDKHEIVNSQQIQHLFRQYWQGY